MLRPASWSIATLSLLLAIVAPNTWSDPDSTRPQLRILPRFKTESRQVFRQYVRSEEELGVHFEAHIKRVRMLGRALFARNRNVYLAQGLDESQVLEFLSLHDQAKWDNSPEFRSLYHDEPTHFEDSRSFLARLWDVYGTSDLPRIKPIVEALNRADERVAERYFAGLQIPESRKSRVIALLKQIERVADRVDRNLDPVAAEEFGRKVGARGPPISTFLEGEDLRLAEALIPEYESIVRSQTYSAVKFRRCWEKRHQGAAVNIVQ